MIGFWVYKFRSKFTCMCQRFFEFQKEIMDGFTLNPDTALAAHGRPCHPLPPMPAYASLYRLAMKARSSPIRHRFVWMTCIGGSRWWHGFDRRISCQQVSDRHGLRLHDRTRMGVTSHVGIGQAGVCRRERPTKYKKR